MARVYMKQSEPIPEIQVCMHDYENYKYDEYPHRYSAYYLMPIKLGEITRNSRSEFVHETGIKTKTLDDMRSILFAKAASGELAQYLPSQFRTAIAAAVTKPTAKKVYKFSLSQLLSKGVWQQFVALRPADVAKIASADHEFELSEEDMKKLKLSTENNGA